jgi:hypothetical protein
MVTTKMTIIIIWELQWLYKINLQALLHRPDAPNFVADELGIQCMLSITSLIFSMQQSQSSTKTFSSETVFVLRSVRVSKHEFFNHLAIAHDRDVREDIH